MRSLLFLSMLACSSSGLPSTGGTSGGTTGGSGVTCGGELGVVCAASEYCSYPPGQMCDWADGAGKCAMRPDNCSDIYDPVCGCDKKTYSSECTAAMAGVGVAEKGECGTTDCRTTGCPAGQQCQLCWINYQCLPPDVVC